MTVAQFLEMLRGRFRLILGILAGTVLLATLVSFLMPKTFSASASVVVDVKGVDNVLGTLVPLSMNPGYMATQTDIIASDHVAQRVVKSLGLDKNPTVVQEWMDDTGGQGSIEAWLGALLQRKLDVKPSRESNVITIGYKGSDPKFVAAVANAFVQAYIDTNLDLRVEPAKHNASWFDERTRKVREDLETAQTRLSQYQKEHGITVSDERLDVENVRLAELSSQLVAIQSSAADASSRRNQSGTDVESTPEVLGSPLIQGLKAELSRLESKRADLAERVGRNHPDLQRVDGEIRTTRSKIQSETRRVASSLSKSARASVERETTIKTALEAQRAKVLTLKKERDDIAVLQRDLENAQKAYDLVTQRLAQTNLESQTQQTNISFLTRASEPSEPSSPKVLLNLLASVFLGTLLGLGTALYLEMSEQRIRSPNDVERLAGLTPIGMIPLHASKF